MAEGLEAVVSVRAPKPGVVHAAKGQSPVQKMHQRMVDDALMLWVVHDTNPHALSPKVKQFVQAQHWFQDLTTLGM